MKPELFLSRLDELIVAQDWQRVIEWCEGHYPEVKDQLTEEGQASVEDGALRTACGIVEGQRRRMLARETSERELVQAT